MANEVAQSFSGGLMVKLESVKEALPKDFNQTRFVQNCLAFMNEHPDLSTQNQSKIFMLLLKGAYLGLDFMKKECYLISYKGNLQFQTSYIGERKFVKKYAVNPIKDIYAKCVREGDVFTERITDGRQSIDFAPLPFNRGAIVGVFAIVLYKDGSMDYETMAKEDVNAVRNAYSKAANSKPWTNSWDEMAKKVVLRRLCKHIDTDFESVEARNAWEDGSDADFSSKNVVRSAKPVESDPFTDLDEKDVFDGDMEVVDE